MNRLTAEEINAFNPSPDNPLLVESDTGAFRLFGNKIQIISPVINGQLSFIGECGMSIQTEDRLKEFPSIGQKEVLKKELDKRIADLESFVYFAFDSNALMNLIEDLKYNVEKHFGFKPEKE